MNQFGRVKANGLELGKGCFVASGDEKSLPLLQLFTGDHPLDGHDV